ncbi:hypothetical protein Q8A67_020900 [Cirrhinus molitorella]|uniref:Uncharacterized protein n=1 Tax=Cirrhinus molitorella TaxID=172907 RepID=A0AA88P621_9TELE|nr:hypothetical protein Q8A67_020900 [Cirrhinus molitorella]
MSRRGGSPAGVDVGGSRSVGRLKRYLLSGVIKLESKCLQDLHCAPGPLFPVRPGDVNCPGALQVEPGLGAEMGQKDTKEQESSGAKRHLPNRRHAEQLSGCLSLCATVLADLSREPQQMLSQGDKGPAAFETR